MMDTKSAACAISLRNSAGEAGFVDKSIALKYKFEAASVKAVATHLFGVERDPLSSSDNLKTDVDVERGGLILKS